MYRDTTVLRLRQPDAIDDPLVLLPMKPRLYACTGADCRSPRLRRHMEGRQVAGWA